MEVSVRVNGHPKLELPPQMGKGGLLGLPARRLASVTLFAALCRQPADKQVPLQSQPLACNLMSGSAGLMSTNCIMCKSSPTCTQLAPHARNWRFQKR